MAILNLKVERCKSCEFCMIECPKEAIGLSRELNRNGFNYVAVDMKKCNHCGICYIVCPDGVFEISV